MGFPEIGEDGSEDLQRASRGDLCWASYIQGGSDVASRSLFLGGNRGDGKRNAASASFHSKVV